MLSIFFFLLPLYWIVDTRDIETTVLTADGPIYISELNESIAKLHIHRQSVPATNHENTMLEINADVIKILPLGDSITFGCGDTCTTGDHCSGGYGENYTCCAEPFGNPPLPWTPCFGCSGSYRVPLLSMLQNHSSTNSTIWEYVGTQTMDDGLKHEGHPGWRIDQLSSDIGNWSVFNPDIIMIMAGTNDIGQLYNVSCNTTSTPWQCNTTDIISRLDFLLTQIFLHITSRPLLHVFVSDLIGIGPNPCYGPDPTADGDQMVLEFNAQLLKLVEKHNSKGNKCSYIPLLRDTDIGQGGKSLCPCHYHPTHSGYGLIAQEYFKYIEEYINKTRNN